MKLNSASASQLALLLLAGFLVVATLPRGVQGLFVNTLLFRCSLLGASLSCPGDYSAYLLTEFLRLVSLLARNRGIKAQHVQPRNFTGYPWFGHQAIADCLNECLRIWRDGDKVRDVFSRLLSAEIPEPQVAGQRVGNTLCLLVYTVEAKNGMGTSRQPLLWKAFACVRYQSVLEQLMYAHVLVPRSSTAPRFATLASRKQNEDELEAIISEWTLARTPQEVTEQLQAVGIPAAPSMSNKDLSTDSHLNSRSIFTYLEHPEVGTKQHVGIPWQMSKTPLAVRRPAPTLGQDTEYVLREILGYSAEEVAGLRDRQVLT